MSHALRGSIRLAAPTSRPHCLLDTRDAAMQVQVQLFRVEPMEHDAQADTRAMSLEAVIHQRVKPQRCCMARRNHALNSLEEPVFEYAAENLTPGRYHVLAFTLDPAATAASTGSASVASSQSYTNPSTQAFGFFGGGHAHGNAWPWTLLEVGGAGSDGKDTIVPEFTLRVVHSFKVLRESSASVPTKTNSALLRLLSPQSSSLIPVLRLGASSPRERGYNHGFLLAPYIFDFWRFYLFEYRFCGNTKRYESFVKRWVQPECRFFAYPASALDEAAGVVEGMAAAGISMRIDELQRHFTVNDILAGYIETRSVVASESEHTKQQQNDAAASVEEAKAKTLAHNCSQAVLWGEQTGGAVFAGRNMDGEIDIRKVTASHSILIATERDATLASSSSSAAPASSFRVISLMWPGLIGTLTGINETGLYICENAGESQPDTDLISGLTPVACVQWAALRTMDGRGLTPTAMQQFLSRYISRTGWNHEQHCPASAEAHASMLQQRSVPQYASDTQGGFSGPGSIFVVSFPPSAKPGAKSAAGSAASDASSSAAATESRPFHGFVVEADRSHTMLRLPSQAPPHDVSDCILATNHALALGYDDVGVLPPEQEALRSPTRAIAKCASLSPMFGGAAASGRQTNWNVPIAPKSYWRFEAGRNALQALAQQRKQQAAGRGTGAGTSPASLGLSTLQHLLQVMCPGYTEHSFIGEMRADGSVFVHVAVADLSIGQWAAPYSPWISFEFSELFEG